MYVCSMYCNHQNNVPLGDHNNGVVATRALWHMMHGYILLVAMTQGVLNKLSKEHDIIYNISDI